MAINLASTFYDRMIEAYPEVGYTNLPWNTDYKINGVKEISLLSYVQAQMRPYDGTAAEGIPAHVLGDTVYTMTMRSPIAVNEILHKTNMAQQNGASTIAAALDSIIRRTQIPEIDTYRVTALSAQATPIQAATASDATNAYSRFLDATEQLGRGIRFFAWLSPSFATALKKSGGNELDKNNPEMQRIATLGKIGMLDGIPCIQLGKGIMPAACEFIIFDADSIICPVQFASLEVRDNPPNTIGYQIMGAGIHDLFVLPTREDTAVAQFVSP